MTILEIVLKLLNVLIDLWSNRQNPETAKTIAAATLTKELNDDIDSFSKAIKNKDPAALSAHFELLRRSVHQKTTRSDSDPK